MKVRYRQEFRIARFNPFLTLLALTLGTATVAARVITDTKHSALRTGIHMTAQRRSPAIAQCGQRTQLMTVQANTVYTVTHAAKDVACFYFGAFFGAHCAKSGSRGLKARCGLLRATCRYPLDTGKFSRMRTHTISAVFDGNMQDAQTLIHVVKNLRSKTSETAQKAIVVIDAGIATEDNLQILVDNGFDYICVSRSKLKNYKTVKDSKPVEVETETVKNRKTKEKTEVRKVKSLSWRVKDNLQINETSGTCF